MNGEHFKIRFHKQTTMYCDTYEVLSVAIRWNSSKLARRILKKPVTLIKSENWEDYILLIKALQRGCKQIVKLFLRNDFRVNRDSKTNLFHTPLYYAVRLGDVKIVSLLLDKGALINEKDQNKETALCLAMKQNRLDIVQVILSKYFFQMTELNYLNVTEHYTAYYIACLTNNVTATNSFVRLGIYVSELQANLSWCKSQFFLHYAVEKELIELIELLLMTGINITTKNSEGLTPLHVAFRNLMDYSLNEYLNKRIVEMILLAHNETTENATDSNGLSHFHIACSTNNPNIVKKFLVGGADINSEIFALSRILPGYTPLHIAVYFKCTAIIPLLLQHKADICAVNAEGLTALHMAFVNRSDFFERDMSDTIVDMILSAYGKRTENPVDCNGLSHFHIACTRNIPSIVEEFLKGGVTVNNSVSLESKVLYDYTPIQCAVNYNRVDIVRLLLKYNADLKADDAGLKLLQDACKLDYNKIYELVRDELTMLFDPCMKTKNWISNRNDQFEIIKLILNHKNYANYKDNLGVPFIFNSYSNFFLKFSHVFERNLTQKRFYEAALQEFLIRRNEIIKIFLNYNFDVNSSDNWGYTLLHILANDWFIDKGVADTAELLLKKGADVNARTSTGKTPLHIAVQNGQLHRDLVELFLRYSADVNCIDREQHSTPLHLVMKNFHKNLQEYGTIMNMLLNEGADVNARNIYGRTPLYAACNVNARVLTDLLQYGADINIEDKDGETVLEYITKDYMQGILSSRNTIQFHNLYNQLRQHINRLKAIKYYVSEKIDIFCLLVRAYLHSTVYPLDNEAINKYYIEIETMKSVKIDGYSSLHDMIYKDSNKIVTYMKNDSFRNIMNSDKFDTEFPNYGYLLKMQYRKGLKREPLLEPAKVALTSIIKIELPPVCLESILVYFNNQELKQLIKVC